MYLLTPGREETSSTTLECVSVGGGVLELMEGDGAGGCRRRGQILTHLQTRNTPDPSFTRSPGGCVTQYSISVLGTTIPALPSCDPLVRLHFQMEFVLDT